GANDDVDLWRSPLSFNLSLRSRMLRRARRFARRNRGRVRSKLSRAQRARCFGRAGGLLLHRRSLEQLAFVPKNFAGDLDDRCAQFGWTVSDEILGADCTPSARRGVHPANFLGARYQVATRTN